MTSKAFKICIARGHGQGSHAKAIFDPGSIKFVTEAEITDYFADGLQAWMTSRGSQVLRIRDNMVEQSLQGGINAANEWGAHFYLSLHANATATGKDVAQGYELWVFNSKSAAYPVAREMDQALKDSVGKRYGVKSRGVKVINEGGTFTGRRLAELLLTNAPAMIVELGFVTSAVDAGLLDIDDDGFQEAVTAAIGKAIFEHFGITEEPVAVPTPIKATVSEPITGDFTPDTYNHAITSDTRPESSVERQGGENNGQEPTTGLWATIIAAILRIISILQVKGGGQQ